MFFIYTTQIEITTTDAIPSGYTIALGVSGLSFVNGDKSDRRLYYNDGSNWIEIDSWYGDIGEGSKVYFATQAGINASTTDSTHYRLFWNSSTEVVAETDRDNIFVAWNTCGDDSDWSDIKGTWTTVAGRRIDPGVVRGRTVLTAALSDSNIIAYCLFNRPVGVGSARIYARVEDNVISGGYKGWSLGVGTAGSRWFHTYSNSESGYSVNDALLYTTDGDVDYRVKAKLIDDNIKSWCSLDGTPFTGLPLIETTSVLGQNNRYAGFMVWGSSGGVQFDDLYIMKGVTNEPTINLGTSAFTLLRNGILFEEAGKAVGQGGILL